MTRPGSLRAVPETAPRAIALIRVSKERDGMMSPDVQRVAITDYAAARGYHIAEWLEGLDESGSRARSAWWPRLDQAVAAVESGEYDVIVVWKFSRTARHRLRWAVAIDRVDQAGGRIESATEQVDVTTSTGRFTRGMLGELNAFEAERIGEVWREVHDSRIRAGKPATGRPKWGYRYDRDQKVHIPDDETGPVLADLYRRYAGGESFYSLVHWLTGRGYRTTSGGTWSVDTLQRVLDTGFGAGYFMARGERRHGVHEPVITPEEWQAYLDARTRRRAAPPRQERSKYVLSGLVRCADCKGPLTAGVYNVERVLLRCEHKYRRGVECSTAYIRLAPVEDHVVEFLAQVADAVEDSATAAMASAVRRATRRQEADRLAREVLRAEQAVQRLILSQSRTPVPDRIYQTSLHELTTQLASLEAASEDAQRRVREMASDPPLVAQELLEQWHEWPVTVRRETLKSLIEVVWVGPGESRDEPLVEVVPHFPWPPGGDTARP